MPSIDKIPSAERPLERFQKSGASALSLRECLALLFGSGPPGVGCLGLASEVLDSGLPEPEQEVAFFTALESHGDTTFENIRGLGPTGRARIAAAFEIGRRYSRYRRHSSRELGGCGDLGPIEVLSKVPMDLRSEAKEWLGFVPLLRNGRFGSLCLIERGVRTHVNFEPAELFARLLAMRPKAFSLFHNHPSGDLTASQDDIELTRLVDRLSHELGLRLLGHWIVATEGEKWLEPQERVRVTG